MNNLLKYQGHHFFLCQDFYDVLVNTAGVQPHYFSNGEGVIPCKETGYALSSLTSFYSMEWAPLGVFESLLPEIGPRIDVQCVKDDTVLSAFRRQGWKVFQQPQVGNWSCYVSSSFEDYFSARPAVVQAIVRKATKALEKKNLRVEILTDPCPDEWTEVYDASWKGSERFPRFMPELMECAARLEILRVGIAYLNDEPAAVQLWIVEPSGTATIYKIAYKEKFKSTSVGTVLSHAMFRHAIDEDKVKIIDYGLGDEPYKREWMSKRVQVFQATCFAPTAMGRLGAFAKTVHRALKRAA